MRNKVTNMLNKAVCMGALFFAFMGANTSCAYMFNQPKMPQNVKRLRRF